MPLLNSPSALAAAKIADLVVNARSHYGAAASQLNAVTAEILALRNDDLAVFGNALGPLEMQTLTAAHAQQAAALNALIAGTNAILAASGIPELSASVDTRPLSEKLAEQNREIVLTDGVFSVVDVVAPEPVAEAGEGTV